MMPTRRLCLFVGLAIPLYLFCTQRTNPFEDYSNARAVILDPCPLADGDSLDIFTTVRFAIGAAVGEKISHIDFSADSSRYPPVRIELPSPGVAYPCTVSFTDTGWQHIAITTLRTNDQTDVRELDVYVRRVLNQLPIIDHMLGVPCSLTTPEVGDVDVLYHWSFDEYLGELVEITRTGARNLVKVANDGSGVGTGSLWVSDRDNVRCSPKFDFLYSFVDSVGPDIVCISGDVRDDTTVVTGERASFDFTVRILDQAGDRIDSATVNAEDFDFEFAARGEFVKELTNMDSYLLDAPLSVTVRAWDQRGNLSTKRFSVSYDESGPSSDDVRFRLVNPSTDPSETRLESATLTLEVANGTEDTVVIQAQIGDAALDRIYVLSPSEDSLVSWGLELVDGPNSIAVSALLKTTGKKLISDTMTIYRSTTAIDTVAPLLYEVIVNSQAAVGKGILFNPRIYTSEATAGIDIIAFDEGSGVEAVTINGIAAAKGDGDYQWERSDIPLSHPDNATRIDVRDKSGNQNSRLINVVRNHPLRIDDAWRWPPSYVIGIEQADTLQVADLDGDVLSLSVVTGLPAGMSISPRGSGQWVIQWLPTETGTHEIRLKLSDSVQDTLILWLPRAIEDASQLVRFVTRALDFPGHLQADSTLSLTLRAESGFPPYRFSARSVNRDVTLLNGSRDSVILWKPRAVNVGNHQLMLIVTDMDGHGDSDTLYHTLTVLPTNSDSCTVSWNVPDGTDITPDGEIDMREATGPVTITGIIRDTDHPLTEEHAVTVEAYNSTTTFGVDSTRRFEHVIKPTRATVHDTIRAIVSDRTGSTDTAEVPVVYMYTVGPDDPLKVRFIPESTLVPAYIEVDSTLDFHLALQPGYAPYLYTVRFASDGPVLFHGLLNSTSTAVHWAPTVVDTGDWQLVACVTDFHNGTDTLHGGPISVVPANRDSVVLLFELPPGVDTTETGLLDLLNMESVTLTFTVSDSDHPLTESFDITVQTGGDTTEFTLDEAGQFTVHVSAAGRTVGDTVKVWVTDNTGATDSVIVPLLCRIADPGVIAQLDAWLDTDDELVSEGGRVSSWGSEFTNGVRLVQPDGRARPNVETDADITYVEFNGNYEGLFSTETGPGWEKQPFTIFFVAMQSDINQGSRYTLISSGSNNSFDMGIACDGKVGIFNEKSDDGCQLDQVQSSTLGVQEDRWYIYTYRSETGIQGPNRETTGGSIAVDIWLNGLVAHATLIMNNARASLDTSPYVMIGSGERGRYSGVWEGGIAEFIMYDRALTDSERRGVELYLAEKYGLPQAE